MSNFTCEKCGTPILENENGVYTTQCEHYPSNKVKKCYCCGKINDKNICDKCMAYIHTKFLSTEFFKVPFCGHFTFIDVGEDVINETITFQCMQCEKRITIHMKDFSFNRYKNEIKKVDTKKPSFLNKTARAINFTYKLWLYILLYGFIIITLFCIIMAIWGPHPLDSLTNK